MDSNIIILIVNLTLYWVTFLYYQYKKRCFDGGSIILAIYALLSLLAIDLFYNPATQYKDLTLFPFIYLYVMLMIMFRPFFRFHEYIVERIVEPTKLWMDCFTLFIIFVSVITSVGVIKNIYNISQSLFDVSLIGEAYLDSRARIGELGDGNINVFGVFSRMFDGVYLFLLFYYLTVRKRNTFMILGLLYAVLITVFSSLSNGSRTTLAMLIIDIPFLYLLFRRRMAPRVKSLCKKIGVVVFAFIFIVFGTISIGKFSSKNNESLELPLFYIEAYAAQSFLNFNNYGLDPGGCRYGDRTVPLIKKIMGLETSRNYEERRMKFRSMNMDDSIFYTYVGDFTLDFGVFLPLFIFWVCSAFFSKNTKITSHCSLGKVLLFYILYCICAHGFYLYSFSELGGNLQLMLLLLLYFGLELDFFNKQIKRKSYGKSNCILSSAISSHS